MRDRERGGFTRLSKARERTAQMRAQRSARSRELIPPGRRGGGGRGRELRAGIERQ